MQMKNRCTVSHWDPEQQHRRASYSCYLFHTHTLTQMKFCCEYRQWWKRIWLIESNKINMAEWDSKVPLMRERFKLSNPTENGMQCLSTVHLLLVFWAYRPCVFSASRVVLNTAEGRLPFCEMLISQPESDGMADLQSHVCVSRLLILHIKMFHWLNSFKL